PDALSFILLFELRLALNGKTRKRDRFETRARNWLPRHLADAVGADLNSFKRLIDFVKRVLFLGKQTQREIAVVGIRSGIGLMHPKSRSFAAFSARAEGVLGNAGHGIDHGIAKLKEIFLLLTRERVESALPVIVSHQLERIARKIDRPFQLWRFQ